MSKWGWTATIALAVTLLLPIKSKAELLWDLHLTYLSDQLKYTATSTQSLMFWNTSINFIMSKSGRFYFGWGMLGLTQTENDGTNQNQYSSTEMGPRFLYLSKSGMYQIAVSYHLRNTTTYTLGTAEPASLRGTSLFAELGLMPEVGDGFRAGAKLNYYAPTWTENVVGGATFSQVAYNKVLIIPTFAFQWQF